MADKIIHHSGPPGPYGYDAPAQTELVKLRYQLEQQKVIIDKLLRVPAIIEALNEIQEVDEVITALRAPQRESGGVVKMTVAHPVHRGDIVYTVGDPTQAIGTALHSANPGDTLSVLLHGTLVSLVELEPR